MEMKLQLGFVPRQHSTGSKRSLPRLLIIGANNAIIKQARPPVGATGHLAGRNASRKPRMLVRVALVNTMARVAWAQIKPESYRAPAAAA